MLWIKQMVHTLVIGVGQRLSVIGFVGCILLTFAPIGCTNSVVNASVRYREQHQNRGHLLPDVTVEQLQACVEEYGGQLDQDSVRVGATVQVDQDGYPKKVKMLGVPETARDFESCARLALRNMVVPLSVLNVGPDESTATSNDNAAPRGNELANPIVVAEVLVALGEFAAEHAGRVVLYTVTIQVLAAIAVTGYKKLSEECRRVKELCISSCTESTLPTGRLYGVPFHKCMRDCMEAAGCYHGQ